MGKSTISMAMFNSYVNVYQRVLLGNGAVLTTKVMKNLPDLVLETYQKTETYPERSPLRYRSFTAPDNNGDLW